MTETDSFTIEDEIALLGDMWGTDVHITYRHQSGEWLVSNTTDEGLPVRVDDITVRAATLEGALEKAKNAEPSNNDYSYSSSNS